LSGSPQRCPNVHSEAIVEGDVDFGVDVVMGDDGSTTIVECERYLQASPQCFALLTRLYPESACLSQHPASMDAAADDAGGVGASSTAAAPCGKVRARRPGAAAVV
jgi:hypothetical protein